MRIILSTTFLDSGRGEEFFKGRGRGFLGRMVDGKKEYRCWSFMAMDKKAERTTWRVCGDEVRFIGEAKVI